MNRVAAVEGEEVLIIVATYGGHAELVISEVDFAVQQEVAFVVVYAAFEQNTAWCHLVAAEVRTYFPDRFNRQFVKRDKALYLPAEQIWVVIIFHVDKGPEIILLISVADTITNRVRRLYGKQFIEMALCAFAPEPCGFRPLPKGRFQLNEC